MIKHPAANCFECPLREGQYCAGILRPGNVKLAVVIDSPIQDDDGIEKLGSRYYGKLLRDVTRSLGLEWEEVALVSAVACAAPFHSETYQQREKMRKLATASINHCKGRLNQFLSRIPKDVPVVALGKVAQKALGIHADERLTILATGHKAIATVSVDGASRAHARAVYIKMAIAKALGKVQTVKHIKPTKPQVYYNSLPDIANEDWFRYIHPDDLLCVDIESGVLPDSPHENASGLDWTTSDLLWVGISKPAHPGEDPRVVGTDVLLIHGGLFDPGRGGTEWLREFYKFYGKQTGGHNYKFDQNRLIQGADIEPVQGWDTYLMSTAYLRTHHMSLKDLSSYWVNAPDWDGEMIYKHFISKGIPSTQRNYADIPDDELMKYLTCDVHYNLMLAYQLREVLIEVGRWEMPYQNYLMPFSETVTAIEQHGIQIDVEKINAIKSEYKFRLEALKFEIEGLTSGIVSNPNSTHQVAKWAYDDQGYPPCNIRGLSKRSTDTKARELWPDTEVKTLVTEYRNKLKMISSYLDPMLYYKRRNMQDPTKEGWYVYPSYNLAGAVTGRISATDPAVQTIPWGPMREIFTAPAGYDWVECDLSQAEVRAIGGYSQEPYLLNLYWEDGDFHTINADQFYGQGKWGKVERTVTKTGVFSTYYGATPESAARTSKLPPHHAEQMAAGFRATHKHYLPWREEMAIASMKRGGLTTPYFNRWLDFSWCPHFHHHSIKKEMCNYPVQGVSSDITALAMVKMYHELQKIGAQVVLFLHDAVHFYCPTERVDEAVAIAAGYLEAVGEEVFPTMPFKSDASRGPNWQDAKEYEWRSNGKDTTRWSDVRVPISPWMGQAERYRGEGEVTAVGERIEPSTSITIDTVPVTLQTISDNVRHLQRTAGTIRTGGK